MRLLLVLLLTSLPALAHGGAFRPPPGRKPGDPFTPGGTPGVATAPTSAGGALSPWEAWWLQNREQYLRVRQRIEERTVTSGVRDAESAKRNPFDRSALRRDVLLPLMLEALGDPDEEVRTSAAVALGKFRDPRAAKQLQSLFRDDKVRQVREAAMIGLMLLRDPSLRAYFREVVLDRKESRRIRGFAVFALGYLGDHEFLEGILQRTHKELRKSSKMARKDLRINAALAIGSTGSSEAVPLVLDLLNDKREEDSVRGLAGCALERLGDPIAVPDLLRLIRMRRRSESPRYGAAIAVGSLVERGDSAALELIGKKAHRDRDGGVRTLLAISLGRIGGEEAATYLALGLKRCDQEERGYYHLALGISGWKGAGDFLLEDFRKLKNNKDRAACAIAMGLAGHRKAVPEIRKHVEKGNPAFLPHGMVALGLLDDTSSIPLVQRIMRKERDPMARREGAIALALLRRTAAIPELVGLLERAKTTIERGAIAQGLGLVGNRTAVDPLVKIYRDRNRQGEERAIALAALGRIGDPDEVPLIARLAAHLNPYVSTDSLAELLTIL